VDATVTGIVRLNERPTLRTENEQGGRQRIGDRSLWPHDRGGSGPTNGFARAWIQHMAEFIATFDEGFAPDGGYREGFVVEFDPMWNRWFTTRCEQARRLGYGISRTG
jgi:hypothetical protein